MALTACVCVCVSVLVSYQHVLCLLDKEGLSILPQLHMQAHGLPIDLYVHLEHTHNLHFHPGAHLFTLISVYVSVFHSFFLSLCLSL